MKTDTYFWPKENTADSYMKQFIFKKNQGTVSINIEKLMYNDISRSRSWSRSRGKMALLRNPELE